MTRNGVNWLGRSRKYLQIGAFEDQVCPGNVSNQMQQLIDATPCFTVIKFTQGSSNGVHTYR
jgi:hypothetical protein